MTEKSIKVKVHKSDVYDFDVKEKLESNIWSQDRLKDPIRKALLRISKEFLDFLNLDIDLTDVEDIHLTGSLANYNYTKYSDVDLHILFDFSKIDENYELVKEFLMSKKIIWNNKNNIKIKKHIVEIYPQNIKEKHFSGGIYSILNDEWIIEPSKRKDASQINIAGIKKKVEEIALQIEKIAQRPQLEKIDKLKEKIRHMRRSGLEAGGEYSIENLAFKALRRLGYLGMLEATKRKEYETSLSLNGYLGEDIEWWKKRRKRDRKNYKALTSRGSKKAIKSGTPYRTMRVKILPSNQPSGPRK